MAAPTEGQELEGRVLGRYQLLRRIAAGGMATVYAARVAGAAGFERLVALKRMLPDIANDPGLVRMFLDEARVAAHIRSPYAVSTLDLGQDDEGLPYIVMDLVVGCSLAQLLRWSIEQGRVLPVPAVVEILQHAARGLHDAHEASTTLGQPLRIVHRDVSPQNVLVGIDGVSRITDFGVAHAVARMTKTQGTELKGKAAYCSPEQARGELLDGRSDVFALGIVAWEALTLRRLFHAENIGLTVQKVLSHEVENPCRIRSEIPPELGAAVMRALARDPADRFPTALAFAEAIRRTVPDPVLGDEVRDVVRLVGGASIRRLVDDIQDAVAASSGGAHRWDDAPTVVDSVPPAIEKSTLGTSSMRAIVSDPGLYKSLSKGDRVPVPSNMHGLTQSSSPRARDSAAPAEDARKPLFTWKRVVLLLLVCTIAALSAVWGVRHWMALDADPIPPGPAAPSSAVDEPPAQPAPPAVPDVMPEVLPEGLAVPVAAPSPARRHSARPDVDQPDLPDPWTSMAAPAVQQAGQVLDPWAD